MKTKIALLFDTRKVLTTGTDKGKCHVKLIGSFYSGGKRVRRYFKTDVFVTADEYKKITSGNVGRSLELNEKQSKLFTLLENAKGIIKDNPFVDPEQFGYELTNAGSFASPLSLMKNYAESLRKEGRIGNAQFYDNAISSIKSFGGENFTFGSVTPKWLMAYEKWMITDRTEGKKIIKGRSITTVGMYCRALRTAFNLARDNRKIPDSMYPFGKGKYVIPNSKGRKMALSEDQKNIILNYKTLNPLTRKAVDMWVFSYFCYGMNFADIARLRFSDIKGSCIVFDRTKTINTERDRSSIEIPILQKVQDIMNDWGNKNQGSYVFPVLRDGLTPTQMKSRIHDFIRDTNEHLATACEELKLPKITTYWARHSFATIAYKKGAGLEFLQKALGHSDIKTTQSYINSFDMETRQMVSNWL